MARPRDPRRDEAREKWRIAIKQDPTYKLVDLAKEMDVSPSAIRKWKSTDRWDDEETDGKGSAPKLKESAPKRRKSGAPKGNKNAAGNWGGAPEGNKNALLHGLFRQYIPESILEIMHGTQERNPADLLWDQIQLMHANIINSLNIMYVSEANDMSKELSASGESKDEWEIRFAYEKQATFMSSLATAMGRLDAMIRSYEKLTKGDEERVLKLEKLKLEVEQLKNADTDDETTIDWKDGVLAAAERRRKQQVKTP